MDHQIESKHNFKIISLIVITMASFSVIQWNARGLSNKIHDLLETCKLNLPDIICVQETNLLKHQYFDLEGYRTVLRFGERKSKKEGVGTGLMIAINNKHTGWVIGKQENDHGQLMTATVFIHNKYQIKITNIYRKSRKFSKNEGELFIKMIQT